MKAKLAPLADAPTNAKNYGRDKKTITTHHVVVCTKKGPVCPVDCRVYMGRGASASKVYASIWVDNASTGYYATGTGSAGGGGYHKASAAVDAAIESAGIKLSTSISGDNAIREALTAIARALGYRGKLIIV